MQTAGNVDDGADVMVQHQRGAPPAEVRARWQQSADELRAALDDGDPHERVDWVAGQLTVRTLATTRLAETWIHTGDVADALGTVLVPAERLRHIARLAWRTLPYAFTRAGRALTVRWPSSSKDRPVRSGPSVLMTCRVTTIRGDGVELC